MTITIMAMAGEGGRVWVLLIILNLKLMAESR